MKNDNAHIEQKNWTQVRQILGYMRFDNSAIVVLMNDLYENKLYTLNNYFNPSFKLTSKEVLERESSRPMINQRHPSTDFSRQRLYLNTGSEV